jgi:CxxC motif-containing protein (DUF1111 family)
MVLCCVFIAATLAIGVAGTGSGQSVATTPSTMDVVARTSSSPTEAPAGFDNASVDPNDTNHSSDLMTFEEVDTVEKGLGPTYNAQSCRECHQSPVTGGISQVTELRVGHVDNFGRFTNPNVQIARGTVTIPNRSLINDRGICPSGTDTDKEVQEIVPDGMNVRTLRTSLNTLGDGFIEAINSSDIMSVANRQCRNSNGQICGQVIFVPVGEAPGQSRVARFGWKNQHASLLSFSADAYLNEIGITSRLQPTDATTYCKTTQDPEDAFEDGIEDIDRFARFMRFSKVPARDVTLAGTADAIAGAQVFDRIGCDTCHVTSFTTLAAGSVINGGQFTVPNSLGNKIIHPYSDFLLHNVGTGDGIVQNGGPASANKMRTPPLWGVRLRSRLLHDGTALTFTEAINKHGGEASGVTRAFHNLSSQDRQELLTFLKSL